MSDWFENDELWTTARQSMFPGSSWEAAPGEVASVFQLTGRDPRAGLWVLDLPCGPGRHTLALARGGHQVVAVDRTAAYLQELQETLESGPKRIDMRVELVQADMREFVRPGAFDLAINLFTSLGFFSDIEDDRRVLRNLKASLKPGGHLVVDVMGREILARIFQPSRVQELDDGTMIITKVRVVDAWRWIEGSWTFIKDGEVAEVPWGHRIYTGTELERELRDAGFDHVALYGGFDGRPYDHEAKRLVAVATVG